MPQIDKERAEIYKLLSEIFYKGLLVIGSLVAFFMVLCKLLYYTDSDIAKLTYLGVEGLLAGSVFLIFRHYFPSNKSD